MFMTKTGSEFSGKRKAVKKPWVITDILNLRDERRALKEGRHETVEGLEKYRAVNQEIKKLEHKSGKDIENNIKKNNSKKAYQLVKTLTSEKKIGQTHTIKDKNERPCLNPRHSKRRTEYGEELYRHTVEGDPEVLIVPPVTKSDNYPILREEVEAAVKSLKKEKSLEIDNIRGGGAGSAPAGGDAVISALHKICNKI